VSVDTLPKGYLLHNEDRPARMEMSVTMRTELSDLGTLLAELKRQLPHEAESFDHIATLPIVSSETTKEDDGFFTHSYVFEYREKA